MVPNKLTSHAETRHFCNNMYMCNHETKQDQFQKTIDPKHAKINLQLHIQ